MAYCEADVDCVGFVLKPGKPLRSSLPDERNWGGSTLAWLWALHTFHDALAMPAWSTLRCFATSRTVVDSPFMLKQPVVPAHAGGWYLSQPSVGIFKHETAPDRIIFNPTVRAHAAGLAAGGRAWKGQLDGCTGHALLKRPLETSCAPPCQGVLYLRENEDGSLSAGAIAGIAVGCATGAALLAFAAVLLLRRRRRQRLASPAAVGKVTEGSDSTALGDVETAGEHSGSVYPPPQPLAAQPAGQQSTAPSPLSGPMQQGQPVHRSLELARAPSTGLVSPFTSSAVAAAIFGNPSRHSSGEATPARAASGAPGTAGTAGAAAGGAAAAASRADSGAVLQLAPRLAGRAGSRPPRPSGSQRISLDDHCATPPNGLAGAAAVVAASYPSSLQSPVTPFALPSRFGGGAAPLSRRHGSGSVRTSLDAHEGLGVAALDREPSALLLSASASMLPGTAPLPE